MNWHPSIAWLLWLSDAITVLCNGTFAGLGAGAGLGVVAGADAAAKGAQTVSTIAAMWGGGAALGNGVKHFLIWQHTNPMPNPFRSTP